MKLLCDQMLGSLATWLRFMGIDTYYTTDKVSDDEILNIAINENRILITKDKELSIRAKKKNIPLICITTTDLDNQILTILSHISIEKDKILTRCSCCNALLYPIEKDLINDKVPPKVFHQHTQFWKCSSCDKIYWMGSHYDKILKKIQSFE